MTKALVFFLASQTFILASGFLMFAMIGEINRKLPDEQRISYLLGYPSRYLRVFREYHRLYPGGHLKLGFHVSFFLGVALLLASAWDLGFLH